MKRLVIILLLISPVVLNAQFSRFAGGLGFSSGINYNLNETGNPAIWGRAYYKVGKKAYLVPAFSFFKTGVKSTFDLSLKNYMLQGDFDFHYGIFHEEDISLFAFSGLNVTNIISRVKVKDFSGDDYPENMSDINFGGNLGAALEMRFDDYFKACLSGKYIVGNWSQFVVSLGIIYSMDGNNRRGW
jgi:hypothetical protein